MNRNINVLMLIMLFITFESTLASSEGEQDLIDITKIPMFPQDYNHKIYAGFLNITNYGQSMYYMFFQSQNSPDNDPVILWLNGGPGCSSLIGMTTQHGPFLFKSGTTQMYLNPYSWNKNANVIYLQSPPGVGFGYASSTYIRTSDTQTAKDNMVGLRMFFQKFSKYQNNMFYLAGQSYAGIYIPMLARQILQFNLDSQQMKINLRGMLLGNPCTHITQCKTPTYHSRFFTQFLYTHGFLEQSIYNQYNGECLNDQDQPACIDLQLQINKIFLDSGANIYNVYGECFYPKYPSQLQPLAGEQAMKSFEAKTKNLKHPLRCSDALGSLTLFNTNQFRQGLHVDQLNDTLPWTPCSDSLIYTIDDGQTFSILPALIESGIKIIYYSGDQDAIVSLQGTKWWVQQFRYQFGASIKKSWRPWVTASQNISGMVWQLEGLTLATVIGAGHMVPSDRPAQALQILNNMLKTTEEWKLPDYYQQ